MDGDGGSVAITDISSQRIPVLPQNAPNTQDSHTLRGLDKPKDQICFNTLDLPLNVLLQTKMLFVLIKCFSMHYSSSRVT